MGRQYSNKRPSRARSNAPHQFLVITITFLLGYFTAAVFDIQTVSHWINTQVLAHQEVNKAPQKAQAERAATIPPKPKFEFYTLLANDKVPNSQPANSAASTGTAANTANSTQAAVNTASTAAKSNASVAPQPTTVKIAEAKPVLAAGGKGVYSVQVASFKARQDAEHMKGLLILKGFNVSVVPINHASRGNWFRVIVGPYPSRDLAQKAQFDLAKNEHLHGMLTAG